MTADTASMTLLILQHVACEPPGSYTPFLAERHEVTTAHLYRDGAAAIEGIEPSDLAAVVAMGGPMGVYDTVEHPWLIDELSFISKVVGAGVPFLGVCLGAQLLAGALGGHVTAGLSPEVGMCTVTLEPSAADDPVFSGLPHSIEVLQWHSDTFSLPAGATLLAGSAAYRNQAFSFGSAYGLQFHAEARWALASEWLAIDAYRRSAEATLGPEGPSRLAVDVQAADAAVASVAEHLIKAWLTTFVYPRSST